MKRIWISLAAAMMLSQGAQAVTINLNFDDLSAWATIGQVTSIGNKGILLSTDGAAVGEAAIEGFLGLAGGSLDGLASNDATEGSAILQSFTAAAGDVINFKYKFLTNENTPDSSFNDFGFVSIAIDGVLAVLADTFAAGFGPGSLGFDEMTGTFEGSHTLAIGGLVTVGFGVMDDGDTAVRSGLAMGIAEPATLGLLGLAMIGFAARRRA